MNRKNARRYSATKGFVGQRKKDGNGRMIAVRFDDRTFKNISREASLNQRSFAEQVRLYVENGMTAA